MQLCTVRSLPRGSERDRTPGPHAAGQGLSHIGLCLETPIQGEINVEVSAVTTLGCQLCLARHTHLLPRWKKRVCQISCFLIVLSGISSFKMSLLPPSTYSIPPPACFPLMPVLESVLRRRREKRNFSFTNDGLLRAAI